MPLPEKETTVIHTGVGGAGWFVAIVLALVVAGGAYLAWQGGMFGGGRDINVTIDAPSAPAAPAPAEPAPSQPAPTQ